MRFIFLTCVFLIAGCDNFICNQSDSDSLYYEITDSNLIKYARYLQIYKKDSGVFIVRVFDPWENGKVLTTYLFCPGEIKSQKKADIYDYAIQYPAGKIASMSLTNLGMISMLGSHEEVMASNDPHLIYDSVLYQNFLKGKIIDLGNGMENPVEKIVAVQPDVLLKYIFQAEDPSDEKIRGAGIPIVYIQEFMEDHPLGRAEWIKCLGIVLGKYDQADSVFSIVESRYLSLLKKTANVNKKPGVLIGFNYKGTWYAPGGKSYIANLVKHAGGNYIWANDTNRGGIPIGFEKVIEDQVKADYWINADTKTLDELTAIDHRNKSIRAFKMKQVYHYNKRINPNGGIDYHEKGVVRPDILLQDLILIFHPQLLDDTLETEYWQKLN